MRAHRRILALPESGPWALSVLSVGAWGRAAQGVSLAVSPCPRYDPIDDYRR